MNNFICKIASIEEMNEKWDYEIASKPNDEKWPIWKQDSINDVKDGTKICYYGILDGTIITEASAVISDQDKTIQNKEGLVGKKTAYLTAFRTIEAYQGKGYFSKLYKFLENDLINRGFKTLTLGVEPSEVKNMKIYFNWGYENYIKTAYEIYPPKDSTSKQEKVMVNYYSKEISPNN